MSGKNNAGFKWAPEVRNLRPDPIGVWTFSRYGRYFDFLPDYARNSAVLIAGLVPVFIIVGACILALSTFPKYSGLAYPVSAILLLLVALRVGGEIADKTYAEFPPDRRKRQSFRAKTIGILYIFVWFYPALVVTASYMEARLPYVFTFDSELSNFIKFFALFLLYTVYPANAFFISPRKRDDEKLHTRLFLRITYRDNRTDSVDVTFMAAGPLTNTTWFERYANPIVKNKATTPSALANVLPILEHIRRVSRRPFLLETSYRTVPDEEQDREILQHFILRPAQQVSLSTWFERLTVVLLVPLVLLILADTNAINGADSAPYYLVHLSIFCTLGFLLFHWYGFRNRSRLRLKVDLGQRSVKYTVRTSVFTLRTLQFFFETADDFRTLCQELSEISENEATHFDINFDSPKTTSRRGIRKKAAPKTHAR